MKRHVKRMARAVLRPDNKPRGDLAAADAALVSYPKCGRTWLRMMIGSAIADHYALGSSDVADMQDLFTLTARRPAYAGPRIHVTHDRKPHLRAPREVRWSKASYRDTAVVFLVRDPRDVMVSLYFERAKRSTNAKYYGGTLPEFLAEERGGVDTLIAFYNSWADQASVPQRFLLTRYEELRADPAAGLREVLDFLGLDDVSDRSVEHAVEAARFERMRKLEEAGQASTDKLRPGVAGDEESYKTRRGIVGGYTDYLTPGDVELLESKLATLAPMFGYQRPWVTQR
jgi:hypothetical protein